MVEAAARELPPGLRSESVVAHSLWGKVDRSGDGCLVRSVLRVALGVLALRPKRSVTPASQSLVRRQNRVRVESEQAWTELYQPRRSEKEKRSQLRDFWKFAVCKTAWRL